MIEFPLFSFSKKSSPHGPSIPQHPSARGLALGLGLAFGLGRHHAVAEPRGPLGPFLADHLEQVVFIGNGPQKEGNKEEVIYIYIMYIDRYIYIYILYL